MDKETEQRYLEKSGDEEIDTTNLIENEHGFMSWKVDGDKLVQMSVYGDGQYWVDVANELGKQFNCKTIITSTRCSALVQGRNHNNYNMHTFIFQTQT